MTEISPPVTPSTIIVGPYLPINECVSDDTVTGTQAKLNIFRVQNFVRNLNRMFRIDFTIFQKMCFHGFKCTLLLQLLKGSNFSILMNIM